MSAPSPNGVPELTPADWDRVHDQVQAVLDGMSRRVQEGRPGIFSRPGKTSTARFPLFSYRTFQAGASPDTDAVVVGLDFQPAEQTVRIRGDISGEETGHVFFDEGCEVEVGKSYEEVLRAALDVARRLASEVEKVPEALASPVLALKRGD